MADHFLLTIFTLFSISHCTAAGPYGKKYNYGIILDAGSTSTKLRLFKWHQRHAIDHLTVLDAFYKERFKPGLTSFRKDTSGIQPYLENIINRTMEKIPESGHEGSLIYLMATAGMRLLTNLQTLAIMNEARAVLSNSTLSPFKFSQHNARVLAGEEEASFAWITVNYYRGYLADMPFVDPVGILEMGGGSTQISFSPSGPVYAGKFPVQIAGEKYQLYAESYLMYGQKFMGQRINSYLLRNYNVTVSGAMIANPCMLKGDNKTFIYNKQSIQVIGSGDWEGCYLVLEHYLQTAPDNWCHPKPCAIGRTYQPSVENVTFYAFGGFKHTAFELDALEHQNRLVPAVLKKKTILYCNKTVDEVTASGRVEREFASANCMMGLYIVKLLTEAYKFPVNTQNIFVADKINGQIIGWPTGAMLFEIEQSGSVKSDDGENCHTDHGATLQGTIILHLILTIVALWTSR